jgi:hypothetical protein
LEKRGLHYSKRALIKSWQKGDFIIAAAEEGGGKRASAAVRGGKKRGRGRARTVHLGYRAAAQGLIRSIASSLRPHKHLGYTAAA